ncbi:MAG: 7-cyano-7-deazaguanine synthase [Planctomycetota bacterium]
MTSVLLLSGGMDSIALAWWLRPELCITIDYGQRPAAAEIRAAGAVCAELSLAHEIISADCSSVGSGDLAGTKALGIAPVREWWPFRNQLLVTLAASKIVGRGFTELLIGCLRTDTDHSDATPAFVKQLSACLELQVGGLRLRAPAIELDSVELIRKSGIPVETLAWAHSCHVAAMACGQCRGCHKHWHTLQALGHVPY